MIYLRAGLYAEGPTDYRFLGPLIDRMLYELSAATFPGSADVAETVGIDAPRKMRSRSRNDRIAAAIHAHWEECTLFVIHGDGAGDPDATRRTTIEPGIATARERHAGVAVAACVPVREVEAWMLADEQPFVGLIRSAPRLPRDPESDIDPKATLRRLFEELGARAEMLRDSYRFFGHNVRLESLRGLRAFAAFEDELNHAIQVVAAGMSRAGGC